MDRIGIEFITVLGLPPVEFVHLAADVGCRHMNEARFERMLPGTDELPLLDIVAALPRDIVLGLEVPMLGEAQADADPHGRVERCVEATRDLLARLEPR